MFGAFQSNGFQANAFQIVKKIIGGIAGGSKKKRHARRFYVEHNNEILIFENAQQAHNWTESQRLNVAKTNAKRFKRVKELKVEPPLEKVDLSVVKDLAERYGKSSSVDELLQTNELAKVVTYYNDLMRMQLETMARRIRDEEDEIEMLLLAL